MKNYSIKKKSIILKKKCISLTLSLSLAIIRITFFTTTLKKILKKFVTTTTINLLIYNI